MIVVTKDAQLNEEQGVALAFFRNFVGNYRASQLFAAFTGISSLGNIIVMTFTAARVKQEIAKEGILLFAKFFGESLPKGDPNPIPVGALLLHWSIAVVLIVATWPLNPLPYYRLLTSVNSYTIVAVFSTILGIGMLCLRFTRTSSGGRWRDKSSSNHVISIIAAVITIVTNGFPIIAAWFPPSSQTPQDIKDILISPWYVIATVGWGVLAFSVIYWLVFRLVPPRFGNRRGMVLVVEREPFLHTEHGYYVQYHEIVTFSWMSRGPSRPVAEYALSEPPLSN
jgi:amino acid transporter